MKKKITWIAFAVSCILAGCQQHVEQKHKDELTICDVNEVKETRTVNLSEWVEDFQIVRFENADSVVFRFRWPVITDNYIGILGHGQQAFKLFDRKGKFVCNVGAPGGGPGEYTVLTSGIIDEKNKCIYLTELSGDKGVLVYNMSGQYQHKIGLGEWGTKPKLFLNSDGTISLVQLCFLETKNQTVVAHIDGQQIKQKVGPKSRFVRNLINNGATDGHNHEVWCYNNTDELRFMFTYSDTLYRYDRKTNDIAAEFALSGYTKNKGEFFIFNPLPGKYLATIAGGKGTIAYDTQKNESYFIQLRNDFVGGMKVSPAFADGYFFAMYEPMQLMNRIEKRLKESSCTDEDRKVLEDLYNSLDEDSNNIMFIGKLKK